MERLMNPQSEEAQDAPSSVWRQALQESKQILHIVWDKEGGYPKHAWGFHQWSVRPYVLGYGCDGTTDANIHFIALRLCEELGLDYPALYEQAYADKPAGKCWLRFYNWEHAARETVMPELSELTLRGLLHDLNEINNHSILAVLEKEFTQLGYNVVDQWWNYRRELEQIQSAKLTP